MKRFIFLLLSTIISQATQAAPDLSSVTYSCRSNAEMNLKIGGSPDKWEKKKKKYETKFQATGDQIPSGFIVDDGLLQVYPEHSKLTKFVLNRGNIYFRTTGFYWHFVHPKSGERIYTRAIFRNEETLSVYDLKWETWQRFSPLEVEEIRSDAEPDSWWSGPFPTHRIHYENGNKEILDCKLKFKK